MHFEPIWNRKQIADDHALILEVIRWISLDMYETIAMCDRFEDVLKNGRASIEPRIEIEIRRRYPKPAVPGP